jgi:hypothetical protein
MNNFCLFSSVKREYIIFIIESNKVYVSIITVVPLPIAHIRLKKRLPINQARKYWGTLVSKHNTHQWKETPKGILVTELLVGRLTSIKTTTYARARIVKGNLFLPLNPVKTRV